NASPEGPNNQTLSQKRAQQDMDAAKNASGRAFALAPVEVIGRGSALAESEGMLRPPVPTEQQALYDEQYENQFPRFRVVLLQVENIPLLKITAQQVTPAG